jgi:integrase
LRSFEKYVFPHVGSRPIGEITESELLGVLRKLEARGIHDSTHRVLQRCSAIFRYAILHPDIKADRNPAAGLKGVLTKVTTTHLPSLKEADLPEFLRKLKNYDGRQQTQFALRLTILTFVRPGELRAAEWSEFNLDKAEWRIPAEKMKMEREHIVPLSAQALEVVRELQPLTGRGRFLFTKQ